MYTVFINNRKKSNMKNFNKLFVLVIVVLVLSTSLCACSKENDKEEDNTLSIVLNAVDAQNIMPCLRQQFPDINFEVEEYYGSNISYYKSQQLEKGQGGDIFYYTTFYDDDKAEKYLVDLSGYDFLVNYDKAILSTLDVNGSIYQIPGPITVRYIMLNKTLFEEKGWKIPENFDELVDVCKQIHIEEPDISPMAVGAIALGYTFSLVTSYAQMGYLDTAMGQKDMEDYLKGEASFGLAFSEGLDMMARLIDAGAFLIERFNTDWEIPMEKMFNREAAMSYVMSASLINAQAISGELAGKEEYGPHNNDEFIALPMFGKNTGNKGVILGASSTWAISKQLEQKGNEKKLENALRVLEYISSEEGQLAIRSSPSTIPPLKNLQSQSISPFIREIWNDPTISIREFYLYTGYEHMMVETAQVVYDAMKECDSTGMKDKFIEIADRLNHQYLNSEKTSFSYGKALNDFSIAETRQLCCQAIQNVVGSDFAIASEAGVIDGVSNRNGLSGRLFEGDIIAQALSVLYHDKSKTVGSMKLSGQEIIDLIKNGKVTLGYKNTTGNTASFKYWLAGGEVIEDRDDISIEINNEAIDKDKVYTVAMLIDDYPDGYNETHEFIDSHVSIVDALIEYIETKKNVSVE